VKDVRPHWPGEVVTAGRYELFTRHAAATQADAEPAVYVHGLGGAATNWTDLMGLLADRLDGEAIDLPGFGYSPSLRRTATTPRRVTPGRS
jgi:pimeloyl-ACP methyl ester carboxylesterase